ncbi:hypothetical protein A3F06_01745 [candidate division TM6 bacterium RIFCSPHIGHO2_12_FULL_36_22]|nr:MAG: hypothetical protein A3F06_01745 [candidate division TM6 bacterium RIFCSPHIGHO2_12_FULL_36_22]
MKKLFILLGTLSLVTFTYTKVDIFEVISQGKLEKVKRMVLIDGPKVLKSTNQSHETTLLHAIKEGNQEIIKYIIESEQVDLNKASSWHLTPLMLAAKENQIETVKLLVKAKANIHIVLDTFKLGDWIQPPNSHSAFSLADQYGHSEIKEYLEPLLGFTPDSSRLQLLKQHVKALTEMGYMSHDLAYPYN